MLAGLWHDNSNPIIRRVKLTTVASFNIDYLQYLTPNGELVGDKKPRIATDFDQLKSIYELMVLTRTFDSKAVALQRTGKLGTYASCLGHEAVHIGIGSAMAEEDVVYWKDKWTISCKYGRCFRDI